MKTCKTLIAFWLMARICDGQELSRQTNHTAKPISPSWVDDKTAITCKAIYYRRASDQLLLPVEEARRTGNLTVSGIVLSVVDPKRLAGQVLSFHFDFPEPWDHWYKPDLLYAGVVPTACIGRLLFLCDSGSLTNRVTGAPKQAGADGEQPSSSETNRTSGAAAPRRSP